MVTVGNTGFSVQLNSYPQPGSTSQNQSINWFQYIIYVGGPVNNQVGWEIQYRAVGATSYAPGQLWPPGYTPNPPNTTPWLPVLSKDFQVQSFGPAPSNQILAGSVMQIQLTTDTSGNVTSAAFSVTDPSGNVSSTSFTFPTGATYPIYGFQLDIVGPGGLAPMYLHVRRGHPDLLGVPGTLALQDASTACGGPQPGTGETSNVVYGDVTPATGSTVSQSMYVTAMNMSFNFDKSTFGQDEVTQNATWGSAFWLAVNGFPNSALGFNSPPNLSNANPSPLPTVAATFNPALNPGLTATQVETISDNLPVVNTFGPPPVQAIDDTLNLNFQTFLCPFTISFPEPQRLQRAQPTSGRDRDLDGQLDGANPDRYRPNNNITTPLHAHRPGEHRAGERRGPVSVQPQPDQSAHPIPPGSVSTCGFSRSLQSGRTKCSASRIRPRGSVVRHGPVAYIQAVLTISTIPARSPMATRSTTR